MRRRFINNSLGKGYIIIEPLDGNMQFSLSKNSIEYSTDNGASWIKLQAGTLSPSLNVQKVFIRCKTPYISTVEGIGTFTIQGAYNLSGDIMGLLGEYKKIQPYSFINLFSGSNVVNVHRDFLPATTLTKDCYSHMFYGCTSLAQAPELPATTLATYCYRDMFSGCTSLNYIKMLATNISASDCLSNWVYNVSSTGTFVKSKDAAWDTTPGALGTSGVPVGWTVVNDGEESGGDLINFTIGGTSYQAEEGMTWSEWTNSSYNTDGYYHDKDDDSIRDLRYNFVGTNEYYVLPQDVIIEGYEYLIVG